MIDSVAGQRKLVVSSYNIHACLGLDGRRDVVRTWRVLEEIGADIYGLQEVDARSRQADNLDQFQFFEERTGMHAVGGPNMIENGAGYGNVLLSGWPVVDYRLIDLSIGNYEPRGAISAVIRCADRHVRIVNTHLGLRRRERGKQLALLHEALAGESMPSIFLGDYNMWGRQQRALGRFGAPDARSAAPKTYSARFPLFALDRVWGKSGANLVEVASHRSRIAAKASDHLPLKAVITLSEDGARDHGHRRRVP
jgi:endonuclease/exonuclease/phosphatase family metal-dependent hydrolase